MPPHDDLSPALREQVRASGTAGNVLAARAGIDPTALSRFRRGAGLTVESMTKLAHALGYRIVLQPAAESPNNSR